MLRPIDRTSADQAKRDQVAKWKRAYRAARNLFGPGLRYGAWYLIDRLGVELVQMVYCCGRGNGWEPTAEEAFGDKRLERRPDRWHEFNGQRFYEFRYDLRFGAIEDYKILPEHVLLERRRKRAERKAAAAIAAERAHLALFVDQFEETTV